MTIQGAIYELNNMLSSNDIPCYWKPAIKKIIETVEQSEQNVGMCQQNVGEMSEKPRTDGDLISRDYVLSKFKEQCDRCGKYKENNGVMCNCCALDAAIYYVEDAPSAEKTDGDLISRQAVNKLRKYNLVGGVHTVSLNDINKLPSVKVNGDLISRTDLLNKIWQKEYGTDYDGVNLLNIKHIDIIEQMPSAEKTAEWIKQKSGDELFPEEIVCSKCYHSNSHLDFDEHNNPIGKVFLESKYCPNCGAKMKGV